MEYVGFCFKQVRRGGSSLQDLVEMKMPGTGRAFSEEQVQVAFLRPHCVLGRTKMEIEPQVLPRAWTGGGREQPCSIPGKTRKREI